MIYAKFSEVRRKGYIHTDRGIASQEWNANNKLSDLVNSFPKYLC